MSAYVFDNDIRRAAFAIRVAVAKFDPATLPTEAHRELAEALTGDLPKNVLYLLNEGVNSPKLRHPDGKVTSIGTAFDDLGLDKAAIAISGVDIVTAIKAHLVNVRDVAPLLESVKHKLRSPPDYLSSFENSYTLHDALLRNAEARGYSPWALAFTSTEIKGTIPFGLDGCKLRKARGPKAIAAIADMIATDFDLITPQNYLDYKGKTPRQTAPDRQYYATAMVKSGLVFLILDSEGRPCGNIGYMPADRKKTEADLVWYVSRENRNRGLATEAAAALVTRLMEEGYGKFGAHCMVSNEASIKVMHKLGFEARGDIVATGSEFDWVDMTLSKERFLEARQEAAPSVAP